MQGRKSRFRGADDIERIVRQNAAQNISRFFITDDYFARNKNWEPIFDRLIELREQGFKISFLIQVDTLAHKIPRFIEKAARAGCRYAFIGLESINPDNLVQMKKNQNRTTEYRTMFQAWKNAGMVTYAGFIIGLPGDTPASVRRDLNKYDLETATVEHPRMSREERQRTYWDAWNWYHSDEHVERMMRRRGVRALSHPGGPAGDNLFRPRHHAGDRRGRRGARDVHARRLGALCGRQGPRPGPAPPARGKVRSQRVEPSVARRRWRGEDESVRF